MDIDINLPLPHPKQDEILRDPSRFKVMVAGRRFGKTTIALEKCILMAVKKNANIFYIAPTYRQAKNIAWEMMKRWLSHDVFKKNETELTFKFPNGAIIALKGADNEQSLRGTGLDFCVLDEYSDIKPNVWEEIVKPMLADRQGQCWFIGTPRGYNHFYELWNKANENKLGDEWTSWRLRTADNPYIAREEIEKAKAGDERIYRQEWCAEFESFSGRFFMEFSPELHVIPPRPIEPWWRKIVSIDYGFTAPSAVLWAAIDQDGNVIIYREYYVTGKTYETLAKEIIDINGGAQVEIIVADPSVWAREGTIGKSGAEAMQEVFSYHNIPLLAADNDREIGWGQVREYIQPFLGPFGTQTSRVKIFQTCHNLIREFSSAIYDEKRPEDLKKNSINNNDALDSFRYNIMYLTRQSKSTQPLSASAQRIWDINNNRDDHFNPNTFYKI